MLVEDEALLECAALVTREWYEKRDSHNPERELIDENKDSSILSILQTIKEEMEQMKEAIGVKRKK